MPDIVMLAKTGDEEFLKSIEKDSNWAVGEKWNGFRILYSIKDSGNTLRTRNGNSVTKNVPAFCIKMPELHDTILDGEGMAPTVVSKKKTDLGDTKSVFGSSVKKSVEWQKANGKAVIVLFDILKFKGQDMMREPLSKRRQYLTRAYQMLRKRGVPVRLERLVTKNKTAFYRSVVKRGGEGVMAKNMTGKYQRGKRSADWVKVKKHNTYDFVITGFTDGTGKFANMIGAVKYGTRGHTLGKSSGMTDAIREDMTDNPGRYLGKVAEFECQELTSAGVMLHPRFIQMRTDRTARGVTRTGGVSRVRKTTKSRKSAPVSMRGVR